MKKVKKVARKKHIVQDYFEAILFAFVVAMIIRNYSFQLFKIPSSSMESTMLVGDYLIANKLKYFFYEPQKNDIVTFRYPADPADPNDLAGSFYGAYGSPYTPYAGCFIPLVPPLYLNTARAFDLKAMTLFHLSYYEKKNIVKRIIGIAGDKIEVKDKMVYVNDEPYIKPFEQHIDYRVIPRDYGAIRWLNGEYLGSRDNFGPVVVPQGKFFVMGDNRDVSADSRYWGFLDRKDITGTPTMIFWSVGKEGIRWDRIFKLIK